MPVNSFCFYLTRLPNIRICRQKTLILMLLIGSILGFFSRDSLIFLFRNPETQCEISRDFYSFTFTSKAFVCDENFLGYNEKTSGRNFNTIPDHKNCSLRLNSIILVRGTHIYTFILLLLNKYEEYMENTGHSFLHFVLQTNFS